MGLDEVAMSAIGIAVIKTLIYTSFAISIGKEFLAEVKSFFSRMPIEAVGQASSACFAANFSFSF